MKTYYKKIFQLLFIFSIITLAGSCKEKKEQGIILVGAEVCMVTLHHERGLPDITVYIKYNATEFPGYNDLSVFDQSITSDEFAEACFPNVPVGRHWFVGFGVDSLLNNVPVRGSVPMEIYDNFTPRDTVILVTEF